MKKLIQIFDEKTALQKLLNESDFSTYYASERAKISKDIIWKKNPSLPTGTRGLAVVEKTGKVSLHFRALPAPPETAHLVAHELQHLLHDDFRKMPSLQIVDPTAVYLCAALTSSVHDLVVESDLANFEFDICTDFEEEFRLIKTQLSTTPEPSRSTSYRNFMTLAINFASYRADYDFVSTEFVFDDYSFGTWFSSRYPNVIETADEIYQQLKAVDLSSNDSIKAYLQWALTNYHLTGLLTLKD